MPQEQAPRLSHVGLYVTDVPKMIDFYTKPSASSSAMGRPTAASPSCRATPATIIRSSWCAAARPNSKPRWCSRCRSMSAPSPHVQRAFRKVTRRPAATASARSATATPGRSISATPKATRSRCSATRRGMCRSPAASRSISTRAKTRSTAPPRPIAAHQPGFKPMEEWRAEISKKIAAAARSVTYHHQLAGETR